MPAAPRIRADPEGRPEASLIEAAGTGFLALSIEFGPAQGAVEALRRTLGETCGLPPDRVPLEPAPIRVRAVRLLVPEGDDVRTLAQSAGAGVPPWSAALGGSFTGPDLDALRAAFAGDRDRVRVRVSGTVGRDLTVEGTLTGDPGDLLRGPPPGSAELEHAVATGRLRLALSSPPSTPEGLLLEVRRELLQGALRSLERLGASAGAVVEGVEGGDFALDVKASRTVVQDEAFEASADLAALLASTPTPTGSGGT
jgi:hypothetical protein